MQRHDNPKYSDNHPVRRHPEQACKTIPLTMHSDGGQFQHNDSMVVLSVSGLLNSSGDSKNKSLLIGAWPKSCEVKGKEGTWDVIC